MRSVIRLRESIDRWLRHRWVGPLLLVLLAVVLGVLALHEGLEQLLESAGELCVALAILALARFAVQAKRPALRLSPQSRRGPPRVPLAVFAAVCPGATPLRL